MQPGERPHSAESGCHGNQPWSESDAEHYRQTRYEQSRSGRGQLQSDQMLWRKYALHTGTL